jgi:hypothetical protein
MNQKHNHDPQNLEECLHNISSSRANLRKLDRFDFIAACDPLMPLQMNEEDEKYYIDFTTVRGSRTADKSFYFFKHKKIEKAD